MVAVAVGDNSAFIPRGILQIGADPEFFLKANDKFVSGHTYPCGGKLTPRKTAHGQVQCDGVALEVNVKPAFHRESFLLNFRGVVHDLDAIVREWRDGNAYIVAEPVADFDEGYLKMLPEHAKELGCNPDYNAYSMQPNIRPEAAAPFRTGAGHLHLGWTEDAEGMEHFTKCSKIVKQLDYTVGLRTLMFDGEERRRLLYGRAGAFRPKEYGVEYRVPSNAWCQSEELAGIMYDGCIQAVELANKGEFFDDKYDGLAASIINSNNTEWIADYPKLADEIGI